MLCSAGACLGCADPCLADACHFSSTFPFHRRSLTAHPLAASPARSGGRRGLCSASLFHGSTSMTRTRLRAAPRSISVGALKKETKKRRGGEAAAGRRDSGGGGSAAPSPGAAGVSAASGWRRRRRCPSKNRAGPALRSQRAAAAGAALRSCRRAPHGSRRHGPGGAEPPRSLPRLHRTRRRCAPVRDRSLAPGTWGVR